MRKCTDMYVMGIESSCDETAVAVCRMDENERIILSNCVSSQVSVHRLYGGVVPEIASRAHIEAISSLCMDALKGASLKMEDIDIIGVTYTPGLVGALLVGVNFAKGLSFSYRKPLVPVNHVKGHIAVNYLKYKELKPPFLAFCASGAHTSIMNVRSYTDYETIGFTRDDAIGEAFDKVARVLGIPYPGGATLDRMGYDGNENAIKFPSAAVSSSELEFSFSGLKTSVINYLNTCEMKKESIDMNDIAASFQKTVCDSLVDRFAAAFSKYDHDKLVISGGVSANSHIRKALEGFCDERGIELYMPDPVMCTDNGAMIAAQAYYEYLAGNTAAYSLNAVATGK